MCGIAGLMSLQPQRPVDAARVRAMAERMRARGPDSEGLWVDDQGRLAIAHRRLAIIDLSDQSIQPMIDASGRYVISFNGEIYNYQTLRDQLIAQGVTFRTHSDTEVILELFARHGRDMLMQLRGMFAIAIWDRLAGELFLARDPYGIKPLYYAQWPGRFAFASQVKGLLTDPSIPRDPDLAGLAGYRLWGSVPEPHTLFSHIRSLPAGHWLSIAPDSAGAEPRSYCDIADIVAQPGDSHPDIRAALLDSVRHHLVADVEVGCFLSGGIDSGALVGLMRDCGQERIRTFTLRFAEFAGTPADETRHARMVADHYRTDHSIETIDYEEFQRSLPAILDAMDQPSIDGVNSWFMARSVHRAGLKVAFSGLGGDELFCAYSTFATVPAMVRRWQALSHIPMATSVARWMMPAAASILFPNRPKAACLPAYSGDIASAYLLRRCLSPPEAIMAADRSGLLKQGLEQLGMVEQLSRQISAPGLTSNQQVAILESCQYMRNQLLRDADWAGMAHSLEIRVPLVDVQLLAALAPTMSQYNASSGKQILGTSPARPLPQAILEREKSGFAIPVDQWTQKHVSGRRAHLASWSNLALHDYAIASGLDLPDLTA